jgi:hypothetical protein
VEQGYEGSLKEKEERGKQLANLRRGREGGYIRRKKRSIQKLM